MIIDRRLQFDPALKEYLRRRNGLTSVNEKMAVIARLEVGDEDIAGLQVVSRFGNIVTARIQPADVVALKQHPAVLSLKLGSDLFLDNAMGEIGSAELEQVVPEMHRRGFTGKGVCIGILDWGLDFAHADFIDDKGKTRIRCLWDQRGPAGALSPTEFSYGSEYGAQQINLALTQPDPYRFLGYDPASMPGEKSGMHGSHVAAIAAGGRSGGVAPQSDVIFVHLSNSENRRGESTGDAVRLLEGIDFIVRRAAHSPVVINISAGQTGESKDGSSLVEQAIDYVSANYSHVAVCVSCGNYFKANLHASGNIAGSESTRLRWRVPERRRQIVQLQLWYSGDDEFKVQLRSPDQRIIAHAQLGEAGLVKKSGRDCVSLYHRRHDPNNGDNAVYIYLYPAAVSGQWELILDARVLRRGHYDAWIERARSDQQTRFHPEDADYRTSIGSICCGHHSISCGALENTNGHWQVADFSSSGPTRDGRVVPTISAPGVDLSGARSSHFDVLGYRVNHTTVRKSGTSMATPVVAGTIALMQQASEYALNAAQIKTMLVSSARLPRYAAAQSLRTGAGFLNVVGAVETAKRFADKLYREKVFRGHQSDDSEIERLQGENRMQSTHQPEVERIAGALRQLSREIVEAAGDNSVYPEMNDEVTAYIDEVEQGEEVASNSSDIMSEEEFQRLEQVVGANNLLPAHFLEEGSTVQRAVAKVVLGSGGSATGFMVSRTLFLTNNHVLPSNSVAAGASAQFNYQLDLNGNPRTPDVFRFDPASVFHTNPTLDYSIVRVRPQGSRHAGSVWGNIALSSSQRYHNRQHLNIIQHPQGRPKECALQENHIVSVRSNVVHYTTDTDYGSSGSPVFNNAWDLVALHYKRVTSGTTAPANKGIRIDALVNDLRRHFSRTTGGSAVLQELGI